MDQGRRRKSFEKKIVTSDDYREYEMVIATLRLIGSICKIMTLAVVKAGMYI